MRALIVWTLVVAGCCAAALPATAADAGTGPDQLYWTCEVINAESVPFYTLWLDAHSREEAIAKGDQHARRYLDGRVVDCH